MTPKTLPAAMEWKGQKLLCNGVCVAVIGKFKVSVPPAWWYRGGLCVTRAGFYESPVYGQRASEQSARRAVNRRFKLPPDFGQKP